MIPAMTREAVMVTNRRVLPCYPVYIPTKGRADTSYTAQCLLEAKIPFHLVVEDTEAEMYARRFGQDRLLVLPFHDLGQGSIPARNFIWEHAKSQGVPRHWVIDDNIQYFGRRYNGKRLRCDPGIALRACEDFTDRYENIGISGLNYYMFIPDTESRPPYWLNCRVYSCILVNTALDYRWRGRYNEDTDLCLQVLSGGWCTVLINAFLVQKTRTMTMKGGNSATLYQGDGRLKMARSLERMWPGVVRVDRRFQRPQHVIDWGRFRTPLHLKPGIDLSRLAPNEYGMELQQVAPVKSKRVQRLLQDWQTASSSQASHTTSHDQTDQPVSQ
jgi:hypothetical protein